MEDDSAERSAKTGVFQIFFRPAFVQIGWNLWLLKEKIRQSALPAAFSNSDAHFQQTQMQDQAASCIAGLVMS